MNTATDIDSMDAETLAHKIIASNRSREVMTAILLHYGLTLVAGEGDFALTPEKTPTVCPVCHAVFVEPATITIPADDGPGEEDGPWAEGWEERSAAKADPFAAQCSECGGPDIYHSLGCSKMEGTP